MAETFWTLENAGIERTFEDWGFGNLNRSTLTQAESSVTLVQTDKLAVTAANKLGYGTTCIIRRNRIKTRDGLSGGSRWFYGRVVTIPRSGSDNNESLEYTLVDPWWYLANKLYEQQWKYWGGYVASGNYPVPEGVQGTDWDIVGDSYIVYKVTSHVLLNQRIQPDPGVYAKYTTGQQMRDALQWAIDHGAPITIGSEFPALETLLEDAMDEQDSTGCPNLDVPIDGMRDITCAEVIKKQLRFSPSATTWFDHSTEPYPTFHCRLRDSLPAVTLSMLPDQDVTDLKITPRYDLQRPMVQINYERENSENGFNYKTVVKDTAPDPLPGINDRFGALVITVNLLGVSQTSQHADLTVGTIDLDGAGAVAFWQSLFPQYTNTDFYKNLSVVAGSGSRTGTMSLPRYVQSGAIADWMAELSVNAESESVSAFLKFDAADGRHEQVPVSSTIVATNAQSQRYTQISGQTNVEPTPIGLAAKLYAELSELQYDGAVSTVDQEVNSNIAVGKVLNITGGRSEWAGMRALVVSVDEDVDSGMVTAKFGPAEHLGAADLVELLRINRLREGQWALNVRSGAAGGGLGNISLGNKHGGSDSTKTEAYVPRQVQQWNPSTPASIPTPPTLPTTLDRSPTITHYANPGTTEGAGADGSAESIWQHESTPGTRDEDKPKIHVTTADLLDAVNNIASFREFQFKDQASCAIKRCFILMTEPEDVP